MLTKFDNINSKTFVESWEGRARPSAASGCRPRLGSRPRPTRRSALPVLALFVLASWTLWGAGADLAVLQERFVKMEVRGDQVDVAAFAPFQLDTPAAERIVAEQRADGTWAAVDYAGSSRAAWAPEVGHLRARALVLARTYARTGEVRFAEAARKALLWWAKAGLECPNWWWNQIGAPQDFGVAALLIDKTVDTADRARFVDYLRRSEIGMTGQNRVWLARIVLMRALLGRDEALVSRAASEIANEVCVSDGPEGIASDWSFRQHGPQMQFGNYGASFLMNMSRLANVFATTKWAFPPEKLAIVGNLAQEGFRWTLWNGNMDFSALGRQIRFGSQRVKARAVAMALTEFEGTGWEFPRASPTGFRLFSKSAYAVYRPGPWMASVKMNTREVLDTETWVNGENTFGGHLADGALFTYVSGQEYKDIAPLWKNWRLIPGITSYLDLSPVQRRAMDAPGPNEVTEMTGAGSAEGASLDFRLQRDGLKVSQYWRFSPTGIVCTGDGITATNAASRVVTCVDHVRAFPGARVLPYAEGCQVVENGPVVYRVFASESAVKVVLEERTGNYAGIFPPEASRTVTGRVLLIYIDHGVCPQNAAYRYEVGVRCAL